MGNPDEDKALQELAGIVAAAPPPDDREPDVRIIELARSFPSLDRTNLLDNWDAVKLDRWASGGVSHGEKIAAQFVLSVWNDREEWQCGKFDVFEAYDVWDHHHWQAFATWATKPFTL